MLKYLRKQRAEMLSVRAELKSDVDGILAAAETEARDLTDAESAAFTEARAKVIEKDAEIADLDVRIKSFEDDEARDAKVRQDEADLGTPKVEERSNREPVRVGSEPATYRRGDAQTGVSFVRDMFSVATNGVGADEARSRLERNVREVRALTTVAGAGGEFAPPAWLVSEFVNLARAARPTADAIGSQQLPMGISSVNIPKLATGTATAVQTTQNTAVQNTDATTSSLTAAIVTVAGQQVISQQLLDQSGVNIDDILLQDLLFDYAAKLDNIVLNSSTTNVKGLLQQSGTTAQTYTSGTPTTKLLYGQIAAAIAAVQAARFLPPDTIVMHPRRWAAFVGAADSTGRPLVSPVPGAMNAPGDVDLSYNAQGPVGVLAGLRVITDPQIPTNVGAGTNQDQVIVFRSGDTRLWEGDLKAEAFRETKADQLSVLLRVYNYAAFTCNRYAPSVAVISGTGLTPPAFDGS